MYRLIGHNSATLGWWCLSSAISACHAQDGCDLPPLVGVSVSSLSIVGWVWSVPPHHTGVGVICPTSPYWGGCDLSHLTILGWVWSVPPHHTGVGVICPTSPYWGGCDLSHLTILGWVWSVPPHHTGMGVICPTSPYWGGCYLPHLTNTGVGVTCHLTSTGSTAQEWVCTWPVTTSHSHISAIYMWGWV